MCFLEIKRNRKSLGKLEKAVKTLSFGSSFFSISCSSTRNLTITYVETGNIYFYNF